MFGSSLLILVSMPFFVKTIFDSELLVISKKNWGNLTAADRWVTLNKVKKKLSIKHFKLFSEICHEPLFMNNVEYAVLLIVQGKFEEIPNKV